MTPYSTAAIVFRMVKYSETSVICDAYTREKGLRSYIASGVRTSKKGGLAALYRPLSIVEITAGESTGDTLQRVRDIRLLLPYENIPSDIRHSSVAMFIIEVARNAIRETESNPELFDFLIDWLCFTDTTQPLPPAVPLLFMVELASTLGFGPLDNYSDSRPYFLLSDGCFMAENYGMDTLLAAEESHALHLLCHTPRHAIADLILPKDTRVHLTDELVRYFMIHVAGFRPLQTLPVLREVFS